MASNTIIVSGSKGQLGCELKELTSSYPQFEIIFFDRAQLSIDNKELLQEVFEKYQPAYFVNCAAYTAVDKAESEIESANTINGIAVGNLASLCKAFGTRFIHISTDYVFNGNATAPLKETDEVDLVNAYGASKLLGEKLALQNNPETIIIRTSWVYSFYGKNFVKTMLRLLSEKQSIGVVNDQVGSPTYAADLAEAVMQIILLGKWEAGIYNFSNEGIITWFEFANEIKRLVNSRCIINELTTAQFPTPAKRPKYSVLDKTKIQQTFSLELKDWKERLGVCVDKLKTGY